MPVNENSLSPPTPCLRVLLAENAHATQTMMERMLDKLGHVVVRVHTGHQALEHLQLQHFDLVLMDFQTSESEDVAAATAIRTQEKVLGGHVAMIAMSAHTTREDRTRCLATGIDRYIAKPLNVDELQTILLAFSDPDSIQKTNRPANWNRSMILDRAGGDEKALTGLIETFVNSKSNLMGEMNRAVIAEQAELLERTALHFGDELNYLGASEISRTARELASLGKRKDFVRAGELALVLQSQLVVMEAAMTRSES
jgi:CheY-like chemotaxis protein